MLTYIMQWNSDYKHREMQQYKTNTAQVRLHVNQSLRYVDISVHVGYFFQVHVLDLSSQCAQQNQVYHFQGCYFNTHSCMPTLQGIVMDMKVPQIEIKEAY